MRTPNGDFKNLITMCLYPRLIKNPKYLPNKKNGGKIPECKDKRTLYVPIGCGNCIECRKQKAREWQVRLHEELKIHKYKYFITLTFSNESLQTLCKELGANECNAVCALAVRRFLERWRKVHKVSLCHWLITELGHENTERIHLHGIIFSEEPITNEKLTNFWKYGRSDIGKYCNAKSINYIIKYVHKIDTDHKQYKPQVFCSAGLGKTFVNDFNRNIYQYRPHKTIEYYRLPNGSKVNMPIYYRNHFFNDETRELLWRDRLDLNTIYVRGIACRNLNTTKGRENYERVIRQAQQENESIGYGNDKKEWRKRDYNITLKMLNKSKK